MVSDEGSYIVQIQRRTLQEQAAGMQIDADFFDLTAFQEFLSQPRGLLWIVPQSGHLDANSGGSPMGHAALRHVHHA
jgi:hypothetical protein